MKITTFVDKLNQIYQETNQKLDSYLRNDTTVLRVNKPTEAINEAHYRLWFLCGLELLQKSLIEILIKAEVMTDQRYTKYCYGLDREFYVLKNEAVEKQADDVCLQVIKDYEAACNQALQDNNIKITVLQNKLAKLVSTKYIHFFVRPGLNPAITVASDNSENMQALSHLAKKQGITARMYSFAGNEDNHPRHHRFDILNPDQITENFFNEVKTYIKAQETQDLLDDVKAYIQRTEPLINANVAVDWQRNPNPLFATSATATVQPENNPLVDKPTSPTPVCR